MPSLVGYSFSVAPGWSTSTALLAVIAGAAPVGITIGIGELVDGLTPAIGQGLDTPAAQECYRWVALIVVLFFLTHLADSARTALGRALGRRVTGRLQRAGDDGRIGTGHHRSPGGSGLPPQARARQG